MAPDTDVPPRLVAVVRTDNRCPKGQAEVLIIDGAAFRRRMRRSGGRGPRLKTMISLAGDLLIYEFAAFHGR